jgi:hypothetical protein
MPEPLKRKLDWNRDRRHQLGRHVNHDPRSRNFPAPTAAAVKTVLWSHYAPVLDQGDLGSCTGNATAQLINTAKFAVPRLRVNRRHYLTEADALALYERATVIDPYDGSYPPDDTGSDGLSVTKAGTEKGYFSSYTHPFGFDHFLGTIQLQPVIVGTNWYEDMFDADSKGFVHVSGDVAGGHEYLCLGVNMSSKYVTFLNSWSNTWGLKGRFRMSFPDFQRLLSEDGDVTAPIGVS